MFGGRAMGGPKLAPAISPRRARSGVAPLIFEEGFEVPAGEVWPEHGSHVELGVGQLPEQEIGDPQLARRADQQVRVGPGGV